MPGPLAQGIARRSTGPPELRRVWVLNAALALGTLALFLGPIRGLTRLGGLPLVPWWAVAIGFAAAESFVGHVQLRREAHTFSLSEVALVVGLFTLAPGQLVLAQILGAGVALAFHRGQPAVKLAFNVAHLALEAEVAVLVFRAVARLGDPVGLAGWSGAFAATFVVTIIGAVCLFVAISLAERSREREVFSTTTLVALVGAAGSTAIALLMVELLLRAPEALWLMLVPAGLLGIMFRSYTAHLRRHRSLQTLYDATRAAQASIQIEEVMVNLLERAREMFRADLGEIVFFADGETGATRTALGPGDRARTLEAIELDPAEGVWARVASEGRAVLLPRPITNERLQTHFAARGVRDAMVAPLLSESRVVGMMTVANRSGDVTTFDAEDLTLFETLANHASVSLENARLVRRLEESLAHLTEMNRLKDDFVATVSHELRTPLTSVQGTIKTLLRARGQIDAETEGALLKAANRQSDRLRQLIENLLMVSRIESRQVIPDNAPVQIAELVAQVLEEFGGDRQGSRVTLEVDPELPTVETDRGKFHQIVQNLLENALKYSPADRPVTIKAVAQGDGVVLSIEDRGDGIPSEMRDQVFERFFQVDQTSTRRVGGTGLGLYICRQLAEALGGRLWLERSDAEGSTFSLWVPLLPPTADAEAAEPADLTQLPA